MRKFFNGKAGKPAVKLSTGGVRNATRVEYDGIKFKSKLELYAYKQLIDAGIDVAYEETSYTLLPVFEYNGEKVRAMTFTPDFVSEDHNFIMETKGWATDSFVLRWKLFKNYLRENNLTYTLYMPRTQKQVMECIDDIIAKEVKT